MAPKYRQVSDSLTEMIQDGIYPVNSNLPTEVALSDCYHVSRQTMRQALSLLAKKGLIQKKQGSGNKVVSTGLEENRQRIAIMISYVTDYIFPDILQDIKMVLSQNNYSFQIFPTQNKISLERETLQNILSHPFAGLLVEGVKTALPNPNLPFYHSMKKKNIPFVFLHGGYAELDNAVCVSDDSYKGGYQLTRYLISKGHTRIGGIFNSDDIQGRQRYQGYITALLDAHLPVLEDKLLWFSTEDRYAFLKNCDLSLLTNFVKTRLPGCTAIVVYNDEIAYNILAILQKNGYDIPNTMAVVSFDNSYYCSLSPIPITSLCLEGGQTGAVAADLLLRTIRGMTAKSVSIPWKLVERKSS